MTLRPFWLPGCGQGLGRGVAAHGQLHRLSREDLCQPVGGTGVPRALMWTVLGLCPVAQTPVGPSVPRAPLQPGRPLL